MCMKRMKMNESVAGLIVRLEKTAKAQSAPLWAATARHLSKPARAMAEVSIGKLGGIVPEGYVALVPGTVMGAGKVPKFSVAALRFTAGARASIEKAGGQCLSIEDLLKQNGKGTNVMIVI